MLQNKHSGTDCSDLNNGVDHYEKAQKCPFILCHFCFSRSQTRLAQNALSFEQVLSTFFRKKIPLNLSIKCLKNVKCTSFSHNFVVIRFTG